MTQSRERLLEPGAWLVQSEALLFCQENQGVGYWAIPLNQLGDDDPLVCFGESPDPGQAGEVGPWQMWYHLSVFLDALILGHAFAGGAVHGGLSAERLESSRQKILEQQWPSITIVAAPWGLWPKPGDQWTLWGHSGQILDLDSSGRLWVAVRTPAGLEQIRSALNLTWHDFW
jgi:hypothetical protein